MVSFCLGKTKQHADVIYVYLLLTEKVHGPTYKTIVAVKLHPIIKLLIYEKLGSDHSKNSIGIYSNSFSINLFNFQLDIQLRKFSKTL